MPRTPIAAFAAIVLTAATASAGPGIAVAPANTAASALLPVALMGEQPQQFADLSISPTLPSPPTPLPSSGFLIGQRDVPNGPLTFRVMAEMVAAGVLGPNELVWRPPLEQWVLANQVPELGSVFDAAAPPPVPRGAMFTDFMVGRWTAEGRDPVHGTVRQAIMHFTDDGHYSGVIETSAPGGSAMPTPVAGRWHVSPIGDDRLSLTLAASGDGDNDSVVLRILDRDTIENETDGNLVHRTR